MRKPLIALLTLIVATVALAACGSSSDDSSSTTAADTTSTAAESTSSSSGGGATVDIAADPSGSLAFTKTDISTTAGSDTINFDNESSTPHNVDIEDADGNDVAEIETISGSTATTTADLQPGEYTFYCNIPGHREAGMEGTLTVK
ncbi:MAG: cupredoxin domain-containing protein [Solirubrobacterales bacterium]|nr:cupredoxin domain-containing protein [Solirubrobacterales bacterium]